MPVKRKNNLILNLKKLENLNIKSFKKELNKTKKTFNSFTPNREDLINFLKATDLKLKI